MLQPCGVIICPVNQEDPTCSLSLSCPQICFALRRCALWLFALGALSPASRAQQPIKDINTQPLGLTVPRLPTPVRSYLKTEAPLTRLGAWAYVLSSTLDTGSELFRTNGTKIELVKDINPGVDGSAPAEMALIGGKLYFQAFEPEHGAELWVSDGTAKGTRLLADFRPGTEFSWPLWPTRMSRGRILCLLRAKGAGLWVTDGNTQGTNLLMKGRIHYRGVPLRPVGKNGMLFEVLGSQHVHEVWSSINGGKPVQLMTLSRSTDVFRQGIAWSRTFKGFTWWGRAVI